MSMWLPLLVNGTARAEGGNFWMPESASTYSDAVDDVFYFIYYVDVFFFIVLMGAMIGFAVRYKRRSDHDEVSPVKGNHTLELAWSVLPSTLLIAMFWMGFKGWINMSIPPADAMQVRVIGQKWNWTYQYPSATIDGVQYPGFELAGSDEECMKRIQDPSRDVECRASLVVPADKAVKLVMNSRDVLHSFYIPNFRAKRDVVPGRYTQLWFEAPKAGEHPVFCTEYCGDQHGYMYSKVKVLPQADYDAWHLAEQQNALAAGSLTGAALGEKLFNTKGCAGCHSLAGARVVGPPLNGKFGTTESLEGGGSAMVDEAYLRESILVPGAKIVAGYPPSMPPYQGQLSEADVEGLIEYLKTKQ